MQRYTRPLIAEDNEFCEKYDMLAIFIRLQVRKLDFKEFKPTPLGECGGTDYERPHVFAQFENCISALFSHLQPPLRRAIVQLAIVRLT
jgi:hypothetical protein